MKRCKKRGKMFFGIGMFVAAIAATGLVVSSCGRHHMGAHKDPERMKAMVNWKVNDILDDIDADDAQREEILASVNKLVNEGIALHNDKDKDGHKEMIHAEFVKDEPDGDKLHAMLDKKFETMNLFAHKALDTVLDAHATLSPEQRAALTEIVEEHHKNN